MKLRPVLYTILRNALREGYDHAPLEYFLNKAKKLQDYTGYKDRLRKNGLVFLHYPENDDWYLYGAVKVFNEEDGTEVANATYGKPKEYSDMKGSMDVRPDFRRKGVATMMYDWIEDLTKETLTPDTPHSKSAEAFWKKRLEK